MASAVNRAAAVLLHWQRAGTERAQAHHALEQRRDNPDRLECPLTREQDVTVALLRGVKSDWVRVAAAHGTGAAVAAVAAGAELLLLTCVGVPAGTRTPSSGDPQPSSEPPSPSAV
jgi:hypothetical protein